jgi:hypothetical protein
MKTTLAIVTSLVGAASAFAPAQQCTARTGSVAVQETVADLKSLAEKSNPVLKVRSVGLRCLPLFLIMIPFSLLLLMCETNFTRPLVL